MISVKIIYFVLLTFNESLLDASQQLILLSSLFKSEASASELLENLEDMVH